MNFIFYRQCNNFKFLLRAIYNILYVQIFKCRLESEYLSCLMIPSRLEYTFHCINSYSTILNIFRPLKPLRILGKQSFPATEKNYIHAHIKYRVPCGCNVNSVLVCMNEWMNRLVSTCLYAHRCWAFSSEQYRPILDKYYMANHTIYYIV